MFFFFSSMLIVFLFHSSCSSSDLELCDNFICLYTLLEDGLKTSQDFSNFSNTFLMNERGEPQFVYIDVNVSWLSCDSMNENQSILEYVWGKSPVEAVYGPVQEVLHSAFLFDPLIVAMSLVVEELIDRLALREDILPSWLIIGQVNISIITNTSICLQFNNMNPNSTSDKIKLVLHTIFKKSRQYASGALLNSTEGEHVVHLEDSKIVIYVVLCLYCAMAIATPLIIGKSSYTIYKSNQHSPQIKNFLHASATGIFFRAILLIILILLITFLFDSNPLKIFEHNHISNPHFKTICLVVVIIMFCINLLTGAVIPFAIGIIFIGRWCLSHKCRCSTCCECNVGFVFTLVNICNFGTMFIQFVPVVVQFLIFPIVTTSLIIHYLAVVAIWYGFAPGLLNLLKMVCECICTRRDDNSSESTESTPEEEESTESTLEEEKDPSVSSPLLSNETDNEEDINSTESTIKLMANNIILVVLFLLAMIIATCLSLLFALGIILGITAIVLTGLTLTFIITILANVFGNFPNDILNYLLTIWNKKIINE